MTATRLLPLPWRSPGASSHFNTPERAQPPPPPTVIPLAHVTTPSSKPRPPLGMPGQTGLLPAGLPAAFADDDASEVEALMSRTCLVWKAACQNRGGVLTILVTTAFHVWQGTNSEIAAVVPQEPPRGSEKAAALEAAALKVRYMPLHAVTCREGCGARLRCITCRYMTLHAVALVRLLRCGDVTPVTAVTPVPRLLRCVTCRYTCATALTVR